MGCVDRPGCGAKILRGDGALERYLSKNKTKDPSVCFLSPKFTTGPFKQCACGISEYLTKRNFDLSFNLGYQKSFP